MSHHRYGLLLRLIRGRLYSVALIGVLGATGACELRNDLLVFMAIALTLSI